jgi:hypothetical protein
VAESATATAVSAVKVLRITVFDAVGWPHG